MTLIYVIPDLHGRLDLLQLAAKWIEADATEQPTVVCLGDYIDRGSNSKGLVSFVRQRIDWIKLKGNHEEMMSLALSNPKSDSVDHWLINGGIETLVSYGVDNLNLDQLESSWLQEDADWFDTLPLKYELAPGLLCVHAGVRPGVSLDEQEAHDLLWIRGTFLTSDENFGALIIHGHTCTDSDPHRNRDVPRRQAPPVLRNNRLNLDGRAYHTNTLWIGRFRDDGIPDEDEHVISYGPGYRLKLHSVQTVKETVK
jgi:serine/threonine protein phosphatase 1